MKLKFYAAAACLVMGLSLSAQTTTDKKDKGQRGGNPVEMMTKELGLTDKQQTELKAIFEAEKADRKQLKEDAKADREARKAEMETKRAEMDAKIKGVLTAEQYTKYQELQKNRPERSGKGDKQGKDKKSECSKSDCCKSSESK
jgi:Spy/CpxP family protein refolding chaperone